MVRRCGPLGQCCDVEYFISFPRSLLTLLFTESSNSCIRYLVTNTDVVICHIYIANITLSTGEEVSPEDVPLCIGQKVIVMCSITGLALRWRYERSSAFYNSIVVSPQPLNSFQTELNSIFNGVVSSSATVTVSDSVANTVNGTTIFCDNATSADASNFTINFKGKCGAGNFNHRITMFLCAHFQ